MNWLLKFVDFQRRKRKIFKKYKRRMGRSPDLMNPVSSQEKVQYRKLFGNHTFYALLADKFKVREFVAERVGDKYLVPLLGVFDSLSPEIFVDLPDRFIIKCNHGSYWNRVVRDKSLLDVHETVLYFNTMVKRKYSRGSGERHYDFIEPKIVIEHLLDDNGGPPWDYNIFSYNGRNGFDFAITISSPGRDFTAHFDRHWTLWESNFTDEQMKKYARPKNFHEMAEVARLLSANLDFVRVDLYNINGRIYFGEMTCTPASGLKPINNEFRARKRSEMWELAVDDRRLYQKRKWIPD